MYTEKYEILCDGRWVSLLVQKLDLLKKDMFKMLFGGEFQERNVMAFQNIVEKFGFIFKMSSNYS